MGRIDCFIIWGNGVQYIRNILTIIRENKNFDILYIEKRDIEDIEEFVKKIYSFDTVPWEHLINKFQYLLGQSMKIFIIIVKNKNPYEKFFGEGPYRHIQCQKVKDLKEDIRNKFNPKDLEGKRTEEHIIHGSDYEEQVKDTLKYLKLYTLDCFKKESKEFNTSFHLKEILNYDIKTVKIDDLIINLPNQLETSVINSPHYGYVSGDQQKYYQYFDLFFGTALTDDHTPEAFDLLIKNFDYKRKNYIIATEEFKEGKYIYRINDGAHRAAILKGRGFEEIEIVVAKMFSNKISLIEIMSIINAHNVSYVILKISNYFPNYFKNEDVDILCSDAEFVKTKLIEYFGPRSGIRIKTNYDNGHIHVDFLDPNDGKIDVRIDLIDSFMGYKNVKILEEYKNIIFNTASFIIKETDKYIKIPSEDNELTLRLIEYLEYKEQNPKKKKHLKYISDNGKFNFLGNIQKYTNFNIDKYELLEMIKKEDFND